MKEFAREWALKWVEGCVIGYIRGSLEERKAIPMIKKGMEMLSESEVKKIIENVWENPAYLPSLSKKAKKSKAKELIKKLNLGERK